MTSHNLYISILSLALILCSCLNEPADSREPQNMVRIDYLGNFDLSNLPVRVRGKETESKVLEIGNQYFVHLEEKYKTWGVRDFGQLRVRNGKPYVLDLIAPLMNFTGGNDFPEKIEVSVIINDGFLIYSVPSLKE